MVLTALDEDILRTLLYFDIFHYPLKSDEPYRFLGTPLAQESALRSRLDILTAHHYISHLGDFFGIQNHPDDVARRMKGNTAAAQCMPKARRQARIIGCFPFVRGVLASGSLSKGYMDEKSDLDFFVITAPGRLWIARMLLVMYKRIVHFNSHKYFCVNYFVDEHHLGIEEKNLFTATELATAIPLYGPGQYLELLKANAWLKDFFPNFQARSTAGAAPSKRGTIKRTLEAFFNIKAVSRLEQHFRKMTLRRWEKLYKGAYTQADFEVAFKSKDYASKNHPRNYQHKILQRYVDQLKTFGLSPLRRVEEQG